MLTPRYATLEDRKAFDDFILKNNGSFLQSWEWGNLKEKSGYEPIRLIIEEEKEIKAIVTLLKKKFPLIRKNELYAPHGPVLNFSDHGLADFFFEVIKFEMEKHRALLFRMDPPILLANQELLKFYDFHGFFPSKKQIQPQATIEIGLLPSLEDLLKSFKQKTRYNIRLAEKKGVVVKREHKLDLFYELLSETAKRDDFLIYAREYYEALLETEMAELFLAYHEGEPLAGLLIITFGKKATYLFGASSSLKRNLMAPYLLHWEVISFLKEKGFSSYDLWGVPFDTSDLSDPLAGVYRFKKGFSEKTIRFCGLYSFSFNCFGYFIFETLLNIYQNIRRYALKTRKF